MMSIVVIMLIVCYSTMKENNNSGNSSASHEERLQKRVRILSKTSRALSYITYIVVALLVITLLLSPFFDKKGKDKEVHPCIACGRTATMQLSGAYFCFKHYNAYLFDTDNW